MIQNFFKTTSGSKYFLYFIFLLFLSHNFIFISKSFKQAHLFIFILLIYFFSIFYKKFYNEKISINFDKIKISDLLKSLIIFFPLFVFFIKIYNADFNWGGDYRDNIIFSLVNTKFWITKIFSNNSNEILNIKYIVKNFYTSRIFLLTLCSIIIFFLYKIELGNLANVLMIVIFYYWSLLEYVPKSFGIKDPQGSYFINIFGNLIFYLFDLKLLDTLRLTNLFSILIWATILRPVFLSENIDLKILPFVIFYAWYPHFIYLHVGANTEPWAIIFLFLALENFVKNKFNKFFTTIIFLGLGSCFKSQVSLLIPLFTLFYFIEEKNLSKKISLLFLSILILFNTYSFSLIRKNIYNRWQPFQIENYGINHIDQNFFDLLVLRLSEISGLVIITILCLIFIFINLKNNKRIQYLFISSIYIFLIFFFNQLPQFVQHLFYVRYYVFIFIILLSCILVLSYRNIKYINISLVFITLIIYTKEIVNFFNFNTKTIYNLNFSQWDSDPIYLGLFQIIKHSEKNLKKNNIKEIIISRSTRIIYKIPKYLYDDYTILASPRNIITCNCQIKNKAIINFYPKIRNSILKFKKSMPTYPEGYDELYGPKSEDNKAKCIDTMKETCSIVHLLKEKNQEIIAALGIL